ncbi:hypothetical protein FNV43_RR15645 [Rhamnella rubrinervis]|uniref:Mitochondrial import inner membrane translocase subunit TIM50 n=1 Tax=Rhamnella rubrinervis TaxID=2594499 RepID=A0A8K0GYC9_9ROSA|nr:hypothetical protein FNV43_RR15645 [Rhamnella rubrinervis]
MAGKEPKPECSDSNGDDNAPGDTGLPLEKLNLGVGPRKKLLVLGLHGLLVMRFHTDNRNEIPKSRGPDDRYGRHGSHWVYKRPFIDQFLNFCFERFDVAIWSTSTERNVNAVLGCAIGRMRRKLLFVWPNTAIFPDPYNAEDGSDDVLVPGMVFGNWQIDPKGDLAKYLEGLASADGDVPSYVKEHPFGQPAITPNHPQWPAISRNMRPGGTIFKVLDENGAGDTIFKFIRDPSSSSLWNSVWEGLKWEYDPLQGSSHNVDGVLDCAMGGLRSCTDPKGESCSFLDGLADADDVQSYFGRLAITPDHPDWGYYSKILPSI